MKLLSVSETRRNLSSLINWIASKKGDLLIQNRGRPAAVMIPFDDYGLLLSAREQRHRQAAIAEMKRIAEEVGQRNENMSRQESETLAVEATRATIESLVASGKVSFEA